MSILRQSGRNAFSGDPTTPITAWPWGEIWKRPQARSAHALGDHVDGDRDTRPMGTSSASIMRGALNNG